MSTFDLARIGAGLPVACSSSPIEEALTRHRAVVLQAPPGTGKTTLVPPLLANLLPSADGDPSSTVLVAEPRRVAARSAARRLAQLAGVRPGTLVGHTVRGERNTSAQTRVEFCTTGVLLRRLMGDPELRGVGAVVLDEIHERHLDQDLALAMLAELRQLREDLLVVAMSATISAPKFAEILADDDPAPIVSIEAEQHPLEVCWRPAPPGVRVQDERGVTHAFLDHLAAVTVTALQENPGDALVFVPGAWEVDQLVGRLSSRLGEVAVLPLHGRLDRTAQDAALAGSTGRRVVVSTALAESALTVPGVRLVVDSGLARQPRWDQLRGVQGLITGSESRSAAVQRAGRAARQGPGVVVRCFSEDSFSRMRPADPPEIGVVDLTGAVLDLACWGTPLGRGLRLPDPLPPAESGAAQDRLLELGAVDANGQITALGRRLVRLPVYPRLGRALLLSAPVLGRRTAAEIVALLGADQPTAEADLLSRWRRLRAGDDPGSRSWRQETRRLSELAGSGDPGAPETLPSAQTPSAQASSAQAPSAQAPDEEAAVALVLALAHPDRIARARDSSEDYLLAGGTGARLTSARLRGQPWLAVAELGRTSGGVVIRSAVPITQELAVEAASPMLVEEQQTRWSTNRVTARQVRRLGAIDLSSTPTRPDPDAGRALVIDLLQTQGLQLLTWHESATRLRERLALLHRVLGDDWPAMDDHSLSRQLDLWLGPELLSLGAGTPTDQLDLTTALRRLLPWPAANRLAELVPERLRVPSGSQISVQYPDVDDAPGRPKLSVKLQECFGWKQTPRIVEGRVPVLLELLSPARRPLALTGDLAYFWDEVYPQVRSENRGRYSKHPWPEDPWNAPARSGTTRSGR